MKLRLIICLIAITPVFLTNAQSFFSFDIGFNVPTAGAALPGFEDIKLASSSTIPDTTTLVATLNLGPSIHLGYENFINDNIALGIRFGYLTGLTKGSFETFFAPGVISVNTVSGKMMNISPTLTLSTSRSAPKALYTRSALTFGFGFSSKIESEVTALQASGTREFTGGSAVGFSGAFGGRKDLSDKVSLYGELALTSLMHKPNKQIVTSSDPSGTQEVTYNIVETTGPNSSPLDIRTFAIPYSSIALNIGLKFKL